MRARGFTDVAPVFFDSNSFRFPSTRIDLALVPVVPKQDRQHYICTLPAQPRQKKFSAHCSSVGHYHIYHLRLLVWSDDLAPVPFVPSYKSPYALRHPSCAIGCLPAGDTDLARLARAVAIYVPAALPAEYRARLEGWLIAAP